MNKKDIAMLRGLMRVVSLSLLICFGSQAQKLTPKHIRGYEYFSITSSKDKATDSVTVRGLILDEQSLKPGANEPIIVITAISYSKLTPKQRKDYSYKSSMYDYTFLIDQNDGRFSFKMLPGKYKFTISTNAHKDVRSKWINVNSESVFILVFMEPVNSIHY